jgi:hypothetical protein
MRTTLTLDDDVAVRLKRLTGFSSFKEAINAALRAGLDERERRQPKAQVLYRIQPVQLGTKITNIDNIAEILDIVEESEIDTIGR